MAGKRVLWGLSVLLCLLFGTCSLGTDIDTLQERFRKNPTPNPTPVAGDYYINITSPQKAGHAIIRVTITPKEGKSSGEITVYYEGTGGTQYSRKKTVPLAAGVYTVTFDVAAATGWSAVNGLFAGVLTLNDPAKEDPRLEHYTITGTGTFDFAAGVSRPVTLMRKDNSSPGTVTIKYTNAATPPVTTISAPTEIGAYAVSFDVAAATGWNAASGLSVGAVNIINSDMKTPRVEDYNISGTGTFTYDGAPKAVTATPKSGKSQGARTYTYTNTASGAGTSTAPSAAGTYNVTFTVAADPAGNWNAVSGLNAGTLVITASPTPDQTPVAGDFDISGTGTFTYDGNPKSVTVTPKSGKSMGTVTVKYNGSTTAPSAVGVYTVTFDVAAAAGWNAISGLEAGTLVINAALTYGITLSESDTYTFTVARVDYAARTALTVTVTNPVGNQATGTLTVALSGTNANSFTLSTTLINSITAGETDMFTVVPNTGLGVGTYTATVTVSGSNGISAAFNVSFTVVYELYPPPPTTGIEMVYVPGGSFQMGDDEGESIEKPVHTVTLSGFYMGKYEVTQAQYQAVIGNNPSWYSSNPVSGEVQGNRPVEQVSWYDAIEFCNALSIKEGLSPYYTIDKVNKDPNNTSSYDDIKWTVTRNSTTNGYRLPTEAQWEYAAKGGNGSPGNYTYSGSNTVGDVAWYADNSGLRTHEVGKKAPNGLGIYDMSGNVGELCWDWVEGYSSSTQTNPVGAVVGSFRVLRGWSWSNGMYDMRSATRGSAFPNEKHASFGFRVVRPSDAVSGFSVAFDSNGGSSVIPQTVNSGATATRPTNPTNSGYTFDNWYSDSGLTIAYNFSTPVTGNITLYAKWSTVTIEMVQIPAGIFTMGSPSTEAERRDNEGPQHQVMLSSFNMGKYQVTQEQYQAVMGNNPSYYRNPSIGEVQGLLPVENVSWYNAIVFCNKLSMAEGLSPAYRISGSTNPSDWGSVPTSSNSTWNSAVIVAGSTGYRLPTEAQWEYACRAGTTTAYNTGDTISDNTGWYNGNSGGKTHQVGLKPANAWGLYDMHGNVREWCWDWFGSYPSEAQTNPIGATAGDNRVWRGGSQYFYAPVARSAYRGSNAPTDSGGTYSIGLRLVRP